MLCSLYPIKFLQREMAMESVRAVWQIIGGALAWAWGWIWYGWTSLIDWVTQVGLAQMGITIRETGDIVDYLSGVIAIVAAVVAVLRIFIQRPEGTKEQRKAFFNQLNQSITNLIMQIHSKKLTEMEIAFTGAKQQIYSHQYIIGKRQNKVLFAYWEPAKDEYYAARKTIFKQTASQTIPTPRLDELQKYLQTELTKL